MNKLVPIVLIAAATGYTLFVLFIVIFTFAFFGFQGVFQDRGREWTGFAVFLLIALSPLAVWPYCLKRAAAWHRGERPPF